LDIRISFYCFETLFELAISCVYHIARQSPCKSGKSVARNLFMPPDDLHAAALPPSQVALRTALVRAMAFTHHKAQEKTALEARQSSRTCANQDEERRGGE